MKVILKENVENLGKIGDVVSVSDGYARNYLLPRNLVLMADESNIRSLDHHRKSLEAKKRKQKLSFEDLAKKLESFSCTISRKVGDNEKLFGSVTSSDIEEALVKGGFSIDKRSIQLAEPIKQLGVFSVPIKLQQDVIAQVKVWVVQQ